MSELNQKENPDLLKNTKRKLKNPEDWFSMMTNEEGCTHSLVDKLAVKVGVDFCPI